MPSPIGNENTAVTDALPKSSFRPDIQGLRAIAVIAVIMDHLFAWPTGGFVGVDVFFVVSGFLITGIVLREYQKTEHISFLGFYRRRIRRILPAATLVIVVTIAASFVLLPQGRAVQTAVDGFWAFFFSANWHMALVGTDYFQLGLPPSPLQHYWSLSVEEQFYFVWPWMMLGIFLVTARLGFAHNSRRRFVLVAFIAATVASFVWSVYETSSNPSFAYFSTFSRAWELGVGAILAALVPVVSTIVPNALRPVLGWMGLAGIVASVFVISPQVPFPGPGAALPVLSTALLIAAGTGARGSTYNWALLPLTNRVSRYVGDISYSLYLWHFPVIILLAALVPSDTVIYFLACLATMFVLAILSYHLVENTIRDSAWLEPRNSEAKRRARRRARQRRHRKARLPASQVVGIVASGVLAVVLLAVALAPQPTSTVAVYQPDSTNGQGVPTAAASEPCSGADFMDATKSPSCDLNSIPNELTPSVDGLAADTGISFDCYKLAEQPFRTCNYGSKSADATRVALVGDSHAAVLLPALVPELKARNWSLDTYVGNGCQWKNPLPGGNCVEAMDQTRALLESAADPYDIIITTGARWAGGDPESAAAAYRTAWGAATSLGTKVVVVGDVPAVTEEGLACISRFGFQANDNDCGTSAADAFAQTDPLIQASADMPGVSLVDLTDYFCADDFCPSVIGNVIVYRDTANHVTQSYMKTLAPYLWARIDTAAGAPA
ncbi:acyltransferase [Herbiconiux moechotypicola]|nr:acyltransferase family protein [Herbiconiux moechotypicola]MCS5731513.1 acyltransferase [Herbiconiux moechotypicola]